eukprot:s1348_g12.t1
MTDGTEPEEEERDLPLPRNIDGETSSVDGDGGDLGEMDEAAMADLDHAVANVAASLGEHGENLELFGGPDVTFSDLESVGIESWQLAAEAPEEHRPTQTDLDVFDHMINQAMLSAQLDDGLTLPWEQGIFKSIFDDAPLWSLPEIPKVAQAVSRDPRDFAEDEPPALEPPTKVARTGGTVPRMYERAISFGMSLTDPEIEQNKWARSLEKLYSIFTSCPQGCPPGLILDPNSMDDSLDCIRKLCGSRSPGTVLKRANSLLKFCTWHRSFYYQRLPFPFRSQEVGEFVWEKFQDQASYSTLSSFIEAVNFGVHILGIPALNSPIVDAFTKGVLDQASLKRPGRKQARPLNVKEALHLEACLHDPVMNAVDRYASGAFLFALYGRCRWSDLRSVSSFELDIATEGEKVNGFIGCLSRSLHLFGVLRPPHKGSNGAE